MRFFGLLATFGLVALVAAQDANSTETGTTTAPAATNSLDPQIRCLQKCGSADVCCQAACVNVPCPSQLQANATTECAAQCPQGNGTAAETEQYAECQSACISSYFLTDTATATAAPTGSATGTATFGGSSATTTGSSSDNDAASSTSGSAGAASTGNGADALHVGAVGLGFLGLVVAGLAL
ncbi:uncharacterized protein A1O9_09377 [Exophiala aquamarina CBS 119918]|uniref:Extracellular membrane protein CFEM domain-containing protein n=1 Tax=Exophiala aquamarina CBS 119918 TaxID=1182545 RepID=A0A072P4B2_9EURO|nr:uncharacterized protein A1O9_09377 [Exophiala aquamarina CBS 119918]KEF54934.1 hypothetical protein A1O9_09377 [Exophiala aquamarina CBS 119918]